MEADTQFMQEALAEAPRAAAAGEVPSALSLSTTARSSPVPATAPPAIVTHRHAEIIVLREALASSATTASRHTLYVTSSPAACAPAPSFRPASPPRLRATTPKAARPLLLRNPLHPTQPSGGSYEGVLAADCAAILQSFFAERR